MVMKVGDWAKARAAVLGMAERMQNATEKAARKEAHLFRKKVLRAFQTGGKSNGKAWAPLKPATIRKKGSSKPLIDTAHLRNSISVIETNNAIFVGVASKTIRKGGGSLVNVAAVHEFGKVIAQRRGTGVTLVTIPKRSFLKATADAHFKPATVKARFKRNVAAIMGPGWRAGPKASK